MLGWFKKKKKKTDIEITEKQSAEESPVNEKTTSLDSDISPDVPEQHE